MALRQEKYAAKTRKDRFGLLALVNQGLNEQDAIVRLLPDDSNRSRKFDTWVKRGVWPIPADELAAFGSQYLDACTTNDSSPLVDATSPSGRRDPEATSELPVTTSLEEGGLVATSSLLVAENEEAAGEILENESESHFDDAPELVENNCLTTSELLVTGSDLLFTEPEHISDPQDSESESRISGIVDTTDMTRRPLVDEPLEPTSQASSGLVDDNPDEIKEMMSQLLALHRQGKLARLASDSQELPHRILPLMPILPAKPLSIYCNENLRKMAEAKALQDPELPIGVKWNRSTLTSYLLWRYLGSPTKAEIENWSEE